MIGPRDAMPVPVHRFQRYQLEPRRPEALEPHWSPLVPLLQRDAAASSPDPVTGRPRRWLLVSWSLRLWDDPGSISPESWQFGFEMIDRRGLVVHLLLIGDCPRGLRMVHSWRRPRPGDPPPTRLLRRQFESGCELAHADPADVMAEAFGERVDPEEIWAAADRFLSARPRINLYFDDDFHFVCTACVVPRRDPPPPDPGDGGQLALWDD